MAKKIELGSLNPLVKDIGALYDAHFDHRGAIKSELDAFVREHETKRGNLDSERVTLANKSIASAMQSAEEAKAFGDLNLNKIMENITQANQAAKQQLSFAPDFVAQRTKLRLANEQLEDKLLQDFLAAQKADFDAIDKNFEFQKETLATKYKV